MSDQAPRPARLTRQQISDAVTGLGWRLVLRTLQTSVPVSSLADAAAVAASVIDLADPGVAPSLRADLRPDRVLLALHSPADNWLSPREIDLAQQISAALAQRGLATAATSAPRSAQLLEIAIDALDIPAVRPFWQAVLAYTHDPGDQPPNGLLDPLGQGPALWFQQMDAARPQRNRIHLDISVPHDEASARIAAALAAGGSLLSSAEAPAFWVLADPESNEACITTWQGRD
jgi:4a-hydroxytetrahydrobiopterin dehydratase